MNKQQININEFSLNEDYNNNSSIEDDDIKENTKTKSQNKSNIDLESQSWYTKPWAIGLLGVLTLMVLGGGVYWYYYKRTPATDTSKKDADDKSTSK